MLARFLVPYRSMLGLTVALALAESAVDLARPWPLVLAVDHAIGGRPLPPPLDTLAGPLEGRGPIVIALLAGALMVGVATLGAGLRYLADFLSDAIAERVGAGIRNAVHDRFLGLSLRYHDRRRSGDLALRLTGDVARLQDVLVAWLTTVVPESLTLAGMLGIVLAIDPLMAAAALATVPLLAIIIAGQRRRLRRVQAEYRVRQGRLAALATEVLRNLRAVQAFGREAEVRGWFAGHNRDAARTGVVVSDLSARYGPTADIVLAGGSAVVVCLGVVRVTSGRMTLGVLLVVLSYMTSLYRPIRSLTRLTSTLTKGAASRDRLAEVLDSADVVPQRRGAPGLPELCDGVELRDVDFAYEPGLPILHRVRLTIPARRVTCLLGPNGAGKSTVLNLLLRLYDPDAGQVLVDGRDLREFDLASVRARIALVPQDPWILDGSIADNIRFGRPSAGAEAIRRAAEQALVDEFVRRLPEGYDSQVGEGGSLLSGGQRRRLALARALVRVAPLLLLDEPSAGLDQESERLLLTAIRGAAETRTIVIVTHDRGLAAAADHVVALRGGRVVEQPSHAPGANEDAGPRLTLTGGERRHIP